MATLSGDYLFSQSAADLVATRPNATSPMDFLESMLLLDQALLTSNYQSFCLLIRHRLEVIEQAQPLFKGK
jgi:hypothetical protein